MRESGRGTQDRAAMGLAVAVVFGVVVVLTWPLVLHPASWSLPTAFLGSHVWAFDHVLHQLLALEPPAPTQRAGFPELRDGRFIGWVPALVTGLLRPLGPVAAAQVVLLASLPLTALAAWPLLRDFTTASRWTVAAGCVLYALCPPLLGTLAAGEVPKLQAWCFPLALWAMTRACTASPRALAGVFLLGVATAFTSPWYGLVLPWLALAVAGWGLWRHRQWRGVAWLLVVVAVSLVPAWLYYQGLGEADQLFAPAGRGLDLSRLVDAGAIASPASLVWRATPAPTPGWVAEPVPYLGLPLLLVVGGLAAWRRLGARGQVAGVALALIAATGAMGPTLWLGEWTLPLPMSALEALGYPWARSSAYYRLSTVAALGLSLAAVGGLSGLRREGRWAWLLVLVAVADGVRSTSVPEAGPIEHRRAYRDMAGADGAVLELPVSLSPGVAQHRLLAAVLHRRETTALPRGLSREEVHAEQARWAALLGSSEPREALVAAGVRYVVLRGADPGNPRLRRALPGLGEPWRISRGRDDALRIWDLREVP